MGTIGLRFSEDFNFATYGAQVLNILILAKSSLEKIPTGPADKGLSMEWGLVLIGLIIGLAMTLMPPKRTYEIKKQKEE